jgi:hypothetical protein
MQVLCPMESLGWFTDETLELTSLSHREVSHFLSEKSINKLVLFFKDRN